MSECRVHDDWLINFNCTCSAERLWARKKMLQEFLEKLAAPKSNVGDK